MRVARTVHLYVVREVLVYTLVGLAAVSVVFIGTNLARRLADLGLVNRIAPNGKSMAEALEWATQLANGATRAIGRIKRELVEAQTNDYNRHLDLERALFVDALFGDEAGEGIGAFLEKRRAQFHR